MTHKWFISRSRYMSHPLRRMGIIVAIDSDFGIGNNGSIPWVLRKDMKFFVDQTSFTKDENKVNAVIMGRKCWDSIPKNFRPLKGRLNIVISRTMTESRSDNLIISNNFDAIVSELSVGPLAEKIYRIWNIGGGEIYKLALQRDLVDELVVTKVHSSFNADVHFDSVSWDNFVEDESRRSQIQSEKDLTFTFHFYSRKGVKEINH